MEEIARATNIPEKMPRVEVVAQNLGVVMFRILLPPNLAAGAARDAIAVKVEFDVTAAPTEDLVPALAWLQAQVGAGAKSPVFMQLTRAQLRTLLRALEDLPAVAWANRPAAPLPWRDGALAGVSEHLADPEPAAAAAEPMPAPVHTVHRAPATTRPAAPPVVDGSEHYLAITLPAREHPRYDDVLALLKAHGFVLETSNRRWWLRDRHKTLNFLAANWERLRTEFGAQFTPNFERNTGRLQSATIACRAVADGADFEVTLDLRAGPASDGAVIAALAGGRSYVEDAGALVLLPPATIERLGRAQRQLAADSALGVSPHRSVRLGGVRLAEADAVIEAIAPDFQPPAVWRTRSEALRNLSRLAPAPVPAAPGAVLRPYQQLGAAWLWHLYRHDLGGVLADEMGLGKTLEALALIATLCAERSASQSPELKTQNSKPGRGAPCLVVCPASLVENWRRESARFVPALRVCVHHGGERADSTDAFRDSDLVVTSYGTLVRDQALFAAIEFACVIGDEAQHIKNPRTQNARALGSLRARGRFLLTGTPLENRLDDLRSLFAFLLPGYLTAPPPGLRGEDRAWFDDRLRAQTAPYILRRTKGVVAPELPPKIEQVLYCELPPAQAALYREWQERGERELDALASAGASEARVRFATLTQLLRLRQVCCDPRLVDETWPAETVPPAKLEAFRELLEESVDDGHRLLVFSQFTSVLALLRPELQALGMDHCYLDGSMPARLRHEQIDRFQESADVPVFLISLKAGGTGLNLTGADTVVHFDPWWNPAVEAQATDRAHRLGQTRVVTSYKLICTGTVEEKVLQMQEAKRALLAGVFEASEAAAADLSLADLRDLLR